MMKYIQQYKEPFCHTKANFVVGHTSTGVTIGYNKSGTVCDSANLFIQRDDMFLQ